jgi:PhoPQ-activated pathogenicity-related protein
MKILAHQDLVQLEDPSFQIIDEKRGWTYWVRVIVSPHVAQVLLWEHGEPLTERQKEKHTAGSPSGELSRTTTAKKPA